MNKVALVTGASGGIGYEIARIFARKRYKLILLARSKDKLNRIKQSFEKQFGVEVLVLVKDLSKTGAAKEVFTFLQKKNIHVDVLVNNAGFGDYGEFRNTDWKKESTMIDLNVKALTEMTKLFVQPMITKKSGKILNLASIASFFPGPYMAVYYATKAYVLSFSEAVAEELRNSGVSVTALCPGPTSSGFQKSSGLNKTKLLQRRKLPSSRDVAKLGVKAMMRGQRVAIHGSDNWWRIFAVRFLPRNYVTRRVRRAQGK